MSEPIPSDYDKDDGWNEQNGLEECPHCGTLYSGNGGYTSTVYDQNGRRYEHHGDSDPMDGPFFCESCWDELEANKNAQEHKTLGEYE